jgi:hypothetical protein
MTLEAPVCDQNVETFLRSLFPDLRDEFIERRCISLDKTVTQYFYPSVESIISDWEQIRLKAGREHIYFGVCPRSERKGDKAAVRSLRSLWVDLDFKSFPGGESEARESLRKFSLPPTFVVQSGHGLHLYWVLKTSVAITGPSDTFRLESYLKGLATALNGDPASAELARVLRIPATYNHKDTKAVPVKIEIMNLDRRYDLTDFDPFLLKTAPGNTSRKSSGWIAERIKKMVDGNRHPTFAAMVGRCHHDAWPKESTLEILIPLANEHGFDLGELKEIIDDIYKHPAKDDSPYKIVDGQICSIRYEGNGKPCAEPLCNFNSKAVERLIKDDGAESVQLVRIESKLANGRPLPRVITPMKDFHGMRWVNELGFAAIMKAGTSKQDKLREAIQTLSGEVPERTVFTHTGWRKIAGQWVYLHGNGCIGNAQANVELEPGMESYALPTTWTDEQVKEAASYVLALLYLDDPAIVFPLFAAVHLAPFASLLRLNFMLWLLGTTGTLKSTLAALFLSFFGDFTYTNLPTNWEATANAIERKLFMLKDCLVVIDDYAPSTDERDRDNERKAQRLVRSVGNLSARDRMRSDLTARPSFPPRSFEIATGEHLPTGQSLMARIFAVPFGKGKNGAHRDTLDMAALSAAQENKGHLPFYLADFLKVCARDLPGYVAQMQFDFKTYRAQLKSPHLRVPEMAAWLQVGFNVGLKNLSRFHDAATIQTLADKTVDVFRELAERQAETVEAERPSIRFLTVLGALFLQGKAHLKFGFDADKTTCVGWADLDYIYLRPVPAFNLVSRFCRDEGHYFGTKPPTLYKGLFEDGFLVKPSEKSRFAGHETNPENQRERVLKLIRKQFEEVAGKVDQC